VERTAHVDALDIVSVCIHFGDDMTGLKSYSLGDTKDGLEAWGLRVKPTNQKLYLKGYIKLPG